jgi:predicted RNA-binding Zn-ribbon protein involved in translation (DUF1610 family)
VIPRCPWIAIPRYVSWAAVPCPNCGRVIIAPFQGQPGTYMSYEGDCPCGVHFSRTI